MKVAAVQGDKADLVLLQKEKESLKRQQREGDSLYKNICTLCTICSSLVLLRSFFVRLVIIRTG